MALDDFCSYFYCHYKCVHSVSLPSIYNHLESQNSMESMFFFWVSEAQSILCAVPKGLPLVVHPTSLLVSWEYPCFMFIHCSNKECEKDKKITVAVLSLSELVPMRKHKKLAC